MPFQVKNRREDPRSRIPGFQDAKIEFAGPDGTAHKQLIVDRKIMVEYLEQGSYTGLVSNWAQKSVLLGTLVRQLNRPVERIRLFSAVRCCA